LGKYVLDKDKFIGRNSITLGDKTISFPAPIKYIEIFDEENRPKIVILYLHDTTNVALQCRNNLHCYNSTGDFLWTLKGLISEYNEINKKITDLEGVSLSIKKLDFNLLYSYEFICHYYIHVPSGKIIYLEGHR
jgi:transcriptional regulator of met regulon